MLSLGLMKDTKTKSFCGVWISGDVCLFLEVVKGDVRLLSPEIPLKKRNKSTKHS